MKDTDLLVRNDPASRDDGAKRRQIMDGARQVILSAGFDAASMNEIARVAGVSKGTLYVYFASKEDLFETLIREETREQAEQTCRFDDHGEIVEVLTSLGVRLLTRLLRPASIAHLRTVSAASAKFPRIGLAYYQAGPEYGMRRLATYLAGQGAAGVIAVTDYEVAAHHFADLCKSYYLTRAIFAVDDQLGEAEIRAYIENVVAVFLRAYGVPA